MIASIRILIIVGLLILSCATPRTRAYLSGAVNQIIVTSTNLSEDASILSTKVDELLLLVYGLLDNSPSDILVQETFVFDQDTRSYIYSLDSLQWTSPVLVVLVELDSSESIEQITEQVKKHSDLLSKAHRRHDLATIESILKDDDLLGIQIFDSKAQKVNFNGTWRMDRYAYEISLVAHR